MRQLPGEEAPGGARPAAAERGEAALRTKARTINRRLHRCPKVRT